jgi:hypothetical protein
MSFSPSSAVNCGSPQCFHEKTAVSGTHKKVTYTQKYAFTDASQKGSRDGVIGITPLSGLCHLSCLLAKVP